MTAAMSDSESEAKVNGTILNNRSNKKKRSKASVSGVVVCCCSCFGFSVIRRKRNARDDNFQTSLLDLNDNARHHDKAGDNEDEEVDAVNMTPPVNMTVNMTPPVVAGNCMGSRTSIPSTSSLHVSNIEDAVFSYAPLPDSGPYGKGLLVVVTLFTSDLIGYNVDRRLLIGFFQDQLKYQLMERQNVTKKGLFEFIDGVRERIAQGAFDRLVFAIMTHGLEEGLQTCADTRGYDAEEDIHGLNVLTTVDEIVECFKHDRLQTLKNYPKLFLVQACRGTSIVQAAARPAVRVVQVVGPVYTTDSSVKLQRTVPIDADVLVLHASTEMHYSFVHPKQGSWLIEKTISVFNKHHRTMHVEEMMTIILHTIPELRMIVGFSNKSSDNAVQIPIKVSTFRRLFWLYHVDKEPQLSDRK